MRWPFSRVPETTQADRPTPDAWERHVAELQAHGIPAPGKPGAAQRRPATQADEQALYDVAPSFARTATRVS